MDVLNQVLKGDGLPTHTAGLTQRVPPLLIPVPHSGKHVHLEELL